VLQRDRHPREQARAPRLEGTLRDAALEDPRVEVDALLPRVGLRAAAAAGSGEAPGVAAARASAA